MRWDAVRNEDGVHSEFELLTYFGHPQASRRSFLLNHHHILTSDTAQSRILIMAKGSSNNGGSYPQDTVTSSGTNSQVSW